MPTLNMGAGNPHYPDGTPMPAPPLPVPPPLPDKK